MNNVWEIGKNLISALKQRDALQCGTVCHYTAVRGVGCSLYTTPFNYRLNYSDTVNALQLQDYRCTVIGKWFFVLSDHRPGNLEH